MSSDYFIVPTSPDYFCLQAIGSLGKNITKWHREIKRFKEENNFDSEPFSIKNTPQFLGVIQQRYRPRNGRPAVSFDRWISKIQAAIESELVPALSQINCVTNADKLKGLPNKEELKPYELAHVPDFNSLIPISQHLGKPVFALSDTDIKITGGVFGQAQTTMIESRENFYQIFSDFITRIEMLTK